MSCRRFERAVYLLVGTGLAGALDEHTRQHLADCPRCRARLSGVEQLRISIRIHCQPIPAPKSLSQRIRALLETL